MNIDRYQWIFMNIHGKARWLFVRFGMPFPIPAISIFNDRSHAPQDGGIGTLSDLLNLDSHNARLHEELSTSGTLTEVCSSLTKLKHSHLAFAFLVGYLG